MGLKKAYREDGRVILIRTKDTPSQPVESHSVLGSVIGGTTMSQRMSDSVHTRIRAGAFDDPPLF